MTSGLRPIGSSGKYNHDSAETFQSFFLFSFSREKEKGKKSRRRRNCNIVCCLLVGVLNPVNRYKQTDEEEGDDDDDDDHDDDDDDDDNDHDYDDDGGNNDDYEIKKKMEFSSTV